MQVENEVVNYLRVTSALEIERAKSGHPGICLGSAPIAYSIYKRANIYPSQPQHINRDRIVFSAGHASALYYALLNLFGYDVSIDELKNFRKFGSRTAGHPEKNLIDGIDATTGPLGQGLAMSVGMAIAESYLHSHFKVGSFSPVDHYTYCLVGDGCLMEGVAQEAISLAGNLKLNKLIVLYDKNDITIEGSTNISNKENVEAKFRAQNWNVLLVKDANDLSAIDKAITKAQSSDKPTLIICKSIIGYGSDLAGQNTVHGKPLSMEQIEHLKQKLCYTEPDFEKSIQVQEFVEGLIAKKNKLLDKYTQNYDIYCAKNPVLAKEFKKYLSPIKLNLSKFATSKVEDNFDFRAYGHYVINLLAGKIENMIGGSADLSPSTKANIDGSDYFCAANRGGRNIAFGIREHAMGAIANGIYMHGGLQTFCSTFMSFENYMTPALRMSALMDNRVLYYYTHDTIAVGEDGPTHQPIEQIATLRAMPNMLVYRPCGPNEMLAAMQVFYDGNRPMSLLIPRQKVKSCGLDLFEDTMFGGYVLSDAKDYKATIVSCGSEIALALEISQKLQDEGLPTRVVSMPCTQLFDSQPKTYKNKIINKNKPVFCIEASSDNIWYKYATSPENVFNLHEFGVSGDYKLVYKHFGLDVDTIAKTIKKTLY